MGYYINPPDETKEAFLAKHGQNVSRKQVVEFDWESDSLPVCLVNNVSFTAAAIAYCPGEAQDFMIPADKRPKAWFLVSRELLQPYYPG